MQIGKGISGIEQPPTYGHSPGIYRGPNPGRGPVKAVAIGGGDNSLLT